MSSPTGHWHELAKLSAPDGAYGDLFGFSVSISGNSAIVGSCFDDNNGNDYGSTYIFERDEKKTGHWDEAVKLAASDGVAYDNFGCSVSLSGNSAIVGAYYDDYIGVSSGSVYAREI